jgi:hypothetical protein
LLRRFAAARSLALLSALRAASGCAAWPNCISQQKHNTKEPLLRILPEVPKNPLAVTSLAFYFSGLMTSCVIANLMGRVTQKRLASFDRKNRYLESSRNELANKIIKESADINTRQLVRFFNRWIGMW